MQKSFASPSQKGLGKQLHPNATFMTHFTFGENKFGKSLKYYYQQ